MDDKVNLNIIGAGKTVGGNFDKVRVLGSGDIDGDVKCQQFKIIGASSVKGNIIVEEKMSVYGANTIDGNIKAKYIKIRGSNEIKGSIESEDIRIAGTGHYPHIKRANRIYVKGVLELREGLQCISLNILGVLNAKKEISAESIVLNGSLNIEDLLTADHIDITIKDESHAKEIGGQSIKVGTKGIFQRKDHLIAESIEGDNIQLESTKAKLVRGNKVKIGSNCVIECVEYKSTVDISSKAKVNKVIQV